MHFNPFHDIFMADIFQIECMHPHPSQSLSRGRGRERDPKRGDNKIKVMINVSSPHLLLKAPLIRKLLYPYSQRVSNIIEY